jgi:uncharacterized beta-barrel protein YwiB (DUF1934 family)
MNKNVIISVKGTQNIKDDGKDVLEFITEGEYCREGDSYCVIYKESHMTGMDGTTTVLKVDNDIVTLTRSGSVNSQFVFEQGQKHLSYYDTVFGAFTIGVYANEVNVNVNESGGEIKVDYQLDINNNSSGINDFHMLIREAGSTGGKHSRQYKRRN